MKRVLIFSLAYFPKHVGGAEVAIKEITDRIPTAEIEFHMVTLRFDSELPRDEKIGNVFAHRIGFSKKSPTMMDLQKFPFFLNKYWYQFDAVFAAMRLHRKYHFDGIWAMMAHSCAIPAGILKTVYPDIKYLLTLQEGDPPEYIERLARPMWPLFKRGFTKADILQPISNFLLAWGKKVGFAGVAQVVPNGVHTEHFTKEFSDEEVAHMRETLGKKSDETWLVTTSRLVTKNAVDDVIRALALLPESVHFLVYGIGPDETLLKRLATGLGVVERVHFAGQLGHAEMPLALAACDIFIRPSRSEGFGISFIEAMAVGIPVIATQEGGIADFLFDAVRNPDKEPTGYAVDRDAPEEIAEAVERIIANPTEVAEVTRVAKQIAIERYDWGRIAAEMRGVFDRLFEKR